MLVDQSADRGEPDFLFVHNEGNNTCINITGTGSHDQSFKRRKSHGGVNGFSVLYSSHGGPVSKVNGDNPLPADINLQDLTGSFADIVMTGPVITIFSYAVFFIQRIRDGIHIRIGRKGLVKGCIKNRYLGCARYQHFNGVYSFKISRVMKGCNFTKPFHLSLDFIGNQHTGAESFPSVYHTVTDCINFGKLADTTVSFTGDDTQNIFYPYNMVDYFTFKPDFFTI